MRFAAALRSLALCLSIGFLSVHAGTARAQATEERFQDLFVTAGYCAAFGAALGTAMLAFTENPSENLRYVATGASLGFIGGSVLGGYIIFSPGIASNGETNTNTLAMGAIPDRGVVVHPVYDQTTHSITSIEGGMTLANF
jgi:hypothetical protein